MSMIPEVERWRGLVRAQLQKYYTHTKLTEALVLALIQKESGGHSAARGGAGEVGLLQVIPREEAASRGWPNPQARPTTAAMLGSVDLQVSTGIKILKDAIVQQGGSLYRALMQYAGGSGFVAKNPAGHKGSACVLAWLLHEYPSSRPFVPDTIAPVSPTKIKRGGAYDGSVPPTNAMADSWKKTSSPTPTVAAVETAQGEVGDALVKLIGVVLAARLL